MHLISSVQHLAPRQAWALVEWVVGDLPDPIGSRLRYLYWSRRLGSLGKGVRFGIGVRIYEPEWVHIGDGCWIDDYVIMRAGPLSLDGSFVYHKVNAGYSHREGEIVIGERVHIAAFALLQGHGGLAIGSSLTVASGAKIFSLSHHYRDLTGQGDPETIWKFGGLVAANEQALILSPTVIEDNAAVGLQAVVLPGSTIGRNSWLGAQSLLQGELPPDVVASGNPARIVRQRFS